MKRILLLSSCFFVISVALECLDNADKLINNRCFKFVDQQLSYSDALNWCHFRNPVTASYLATVPDHTTATFLASYARTTFNTNAGNFWIGLGRPNTSSPYQWDDGTRVAWTNFNSQTSQNYVAESWINTKWGTYGTDTKFNFVCSYDPNAPPTFAPFTGATSEAETTGTERATTDVTEPTVTTAFQDASTTSPASSACFDNGDKEIGGSCFKFVAQKLSFYDARNWCHYQNPVTASYLAYIPNQFTANFLASYARSAFGSNDGYFWIGLSRNKSYTAWTWDTGYQLQWTNFDNQQGQNYAAESIVNTKWSTFGADQQLYFVCSYDPTAPPTFGPPVTDGPTPTAVPSTQPASTQTVPTTTGIFWRLGGINCYATFLTLLFVFAKILGALALLYTVHGQCVRPDDKYIGDLCYSISSSELKFSDAQSACYGANSNLAVIHTSLQANFLASIVRSQTAAPEGKFWIGLSRPSVSSRFQWDDGTTMYWSNFDSSFPQNNLYVAESTINGKWQTLDGQQALYYVCSYDPKHVTPGTVQPSYPPSEVPSTGYPASVPVTGATEIPSVPTGGDTTGYPASIPSFAPSGAPVTDSTGYPASNVPVTGFPVSSPTGYPASQVPTGGYPASQTPGYPASQVPTSGYPASQTPGYPASALPVTGGYPVSESTNNDYGASTITF
ncbi:unnamed protein product [Caenorhabditis sp. 36 PRJEB53466]|nr:unnamed protein product [Caenorhabditis sp. 36 PRJEB53466]